MVEERVTVLALLQDRFSGPLQSIGQRLRAFSSRLSEVGTRARAAFNRATQSLRSFDRRLGLTFNNLTKRLFDLRGIVAGLIAFFGVRRTFQFFTDVVDGLDNIAKTSPRIQATVESLQRLEFAAGIAGIEFNRVTTGLSRFLRAVKDTREGSEEYAQSLRQLGVDLENLPLGEGGRIDVIELLAQIADDFNSLEDRAQAAAAAMEVFGRAGKEFGSLFQQGGDAIRALAEEADSLQGVFSAEELARVEAYKDAILRLQTAAVGAARAFVVTVAPALTSFLTNITERVSNAREEIATNILRFSISLVGTLESIASAVGPVFAFISTRLELVLAKFLLLIQGLETIRFLIESARAQINAALGRETGAAAQDALDGLIENGNRIKEILEDIGSVEAKFEFGEELEEQLKRLRQLLEDARSGAEDFGAAGAAAVEEFLGKLEEANQGTGETLSAFQQLGNGFSQTIAQITNLENLGAGLAGTLANSIGGLVDVFTRAGASFSQFAANFLRQIGTMILQVAIFRALFGGFTANPGGGGSFSGGLFSSFLNVEPANKGGLAGFGHKIMRFARGTPFVPGPNVNRDVVHAVLTPGEAVIQKPAVEHYGRRFMQLVNNMMIPKSAISEIVGSMSAENVLRGRFLQDGGIARGGAPRGPGVLPIMPVNEVTAEALLGSSSGMNAIKRAMRRDPGGFRTALGIAGFQRPR